VFFVLFRAPDLALTQIVVETVTTALFLLCFYFLPEWKKEDAPSESKFVNVLISIGVGIVFIIVALSVQSGILFDSIVAYFGSDVCQRVDFDRGCDCVYTCGTFC